MPYQIPRPRGKRNLCALLGAALLAFAAPAAAQACTVATANESQAFAQLGDPSYYTLVPGSDFRTGTDGWSTSGASVTTRLAALAFNGSTNSDALQIGAGGSAVSPVICVSNATPTFRFFGLAGGVSLLQVNLLWTDAIGFSHVSPVGILTPSGGWRASSPLMLGTALPLWMPGSTLRVRVQFVPVGDDPWAIDEIYVDPYSRG
jgi:hypothetical protein